jgi:glutaredoxin
MADAPNEIIMYSRERFCPDVARSRAHLTNLDIEAEKAAGAEVERLTGGRSVPTLVIGERILVEPSRARLDDAIIAAGYDLDE